MSTGNTVSCIRSILWNHIESAAGKNAGKNTEKNTGKEHRKEHRGGLLGALMRMESGHGAQSGIWKLETTEFTVLGWQCHPFLFQ